MNKIYVSVICSSVLIFAPILASAQAVNTSATVQQSFLSELQSLQKQLAALEATIDAMIVAAGGSLPSALAGTANSSSPSAALPHVQTTLLPPSNLSGAMLTDSLLQAIAPASTTVLFSNSTTTEGDISNAPSSQNIATQLDPSCIAGLWGNGAQCGGLYYCGVGVAGGYWSSTVCPSVE